MIKVENLTLSLAAQSGNVEILRGIDLHIEAAKKMGLVGPSGSGKSSLLMVLAGLEQATSGRVLLAGQDISAMDEDERALFRRQNVGIVFQSFHLIPTMTAVENVALPLELLGEKNIFEKAKEFLARIGLAERLHHYPRQLSGGEQQRVAIARALISKPNILLADELTGNLDQQTGSQIMQLVFDLVHEQKTTFLLITHDIHLANQCDETLHMRDGRISDEGAVT